MSISFQVSALPYRTVRNAILATVVMWAFIGVVLSPIWFAHNLVPKSGGGAANSTSNHSSSNISSSLDDKNESSEAELCQDEDEINSNETCGSLGESGTLYWCRCSEKEGYSLSGFYIAFFASGTQMSKMLSKILR